MQVKIDGRDCKLVFSGTERETAAGFVRTVTTEWGMDDPLATEIEAIVLATPDHGEVEWTVPEASLEDVRAALEASGATEQAEQVHEHSQRVIFGAARE